MTEPHSTDENIISADIQIAAEAAKVWSVIADYNAMYTWAEGIEDTLAVTDQKTGVGAIRRNTAQGFGAIDQEITEWSDGEGFTYRAGEFGPFSQTLTSYHLHAGGQGSCDCRLQILYELKDPAMAGSEGEAQLKAKLASGLRDILGALKKRVETGALVRPYKTA